MASSIITDGGMRSGFYDCLSESNLDRKYNAEDMGQIFGTLITDGFVPRLDGNPTFKVSASGTDKPRFIITKGMAWHNGFWFRMSGDIAYVVTPGGTLRFDSVFLVFDWTFTNTGRTAYFEYHTGTSSSYPGTPSGSTTKHYYRIANIKVNANAGNLFDSDITNLTGDESYPDSLRRCRLRIPATTTGVSIRRSTVSATNVVIDDEFIFDEEWSTPPSSSLPIEDEPINSVREYVKVGSFDVAEDTLEDVYSWTYTLPDNTEEIYVRWTNMTNASTTAQSSFTTTIFGANMSGSFIPTAKSGTTLNGYTIVKKLPGGLVYIRSGGSTSSVLYTGGYAISVYNPIPITNDSDNTIKFTNLKNYAYQVVSGQIEVYAR